MDGVHWQVTPCSVTLSVPLLMASSYVCATVDAVPPLDAEPAGVAADEADVALPKKRSIAMKVDGSTDNKIPCNMQSVNEFSALFSSPFWAKRAEDDCETMIDSKAQM